MYLVKLEVLVEVWSLELKDQNNAFQLNTTSMQR